jgi:hypothetical protein
MTRLARANISSRIIQLKLAGFIGAQENCGEYEGAICDDTVSKSSPSFSKTSFFASKSTSF